MSATSSRVKPSISIRTMTSACARGSFCKTDRTAISSRRLGVIGLAECRLQLVLAQRARLSQPVRR